MRPMAFSLFFRFFRRDENQGLAFGSTPAFTRALAAKESLVHFDNASQPVAAGTDHGTRSFAAIPMPCDSCQGQAPFAAPVR